MELKKNTFFWFVLLFVGSVFLGVLLMTLAFCLPDEPIYQNVKNSMSVLKAEGDYPRLESHLEGSQLDLFTDAIMLMHTAYKDGNHNAFDRGLHAYESWQDNKMPVEILNDYFYAPKNGYESDYTRYWHGYLVFLRPLFLIFTYEQVRVFLCVLEIILCITILYLLVKNKQTLLVIPFITSLLFFNPPTTWLCMQYANMVIYMLFVSILFLLFSKKLILGNRLYLFFFGVGMGAAFFDFLTYPLISLCYPLIFWMTMYGEKENKNFLLNLKKLFFFTLSWGLGYVLFWASKWLLGLIFIGPEALKNALDVLSQRTSSSVEGNISEISSVKLRLMAVVKNMTIFFHKRYLLIGVLAVIFETVSILIARIKYRVRFIKKGETLQILFYLALAISPMLWYIVIANHSYIHFFFTFRALTITVFACTVLITQIFRLESLGQLPTT